MIAVFGIWRIKWARSPRYKAKAPSSWTTSCKVCTKERYREPSSRNRVRMTSGETKRELGLAAWSYRHGMSHGGEQKQGEWTPHHVDMRCTRHTFWRQQQLPLVQRNHGCLVKVWVVGKGNDDCFSAAVSVLHRWQSVWWSLTLQHRRQWYHGKIHEGLQCGTHAWHTGEHCWLSPPSPCKEEEGLEQQTPPLTWNAVVNATESFPACPEDLCSKSQTPTHPHPQTSPDLTQSGSALLACLTWLPAASWFSLTRSGWWVWQRQCLENGRARQP